MEFKVTTAAVLRTLGFCITDAHAWQADNGDGVFMAAMEWNADLIKNIEIQGVDSLRPTADAITLAASPEDTNSITRPRNVVSVAAKVQGIQPRFGCTLPANSIVVLKLKARS